MIFKHCGPRFARLNPNNTRLRTSFIMSKLRPLKWLNIGPLWQPRFCLYFLIWIHTVKLCVTDFSSREIAFFCLWLLTKKSYIAFKNKCIKVDKSWWWHDVWIYIFYFLLTYIGTYVRTWYVHTWCVEYCMNSELYERFLSISYLLFIFSGSHGSSPQPQQHTTLNVSHSLCQNRGR